MKNSIIYCILSILFISCGHDPTEIQEPSFVNKESPSSWDKPYSKKEILTLKKYVKIKNNRLILDIDLNKAIDSLNVKKQAYEDLLNNIKNVNNVIDSAEAHSYYINLNLNESLKSIGPLKNPSFNTFYYQPTFNSLNLPTKAIDTLNKVKPKVIEYIIQYHIPDCRMAANSTVEFHTDYHIVISATSVNTSVFYWTFMIYEDVWKDSWGKNGYGAFGPGGLEGPIAHHWTYLLVDSRYGCAWRFRNVSSDTDGVKISHNFYEYTESMLKPPHKD